MEQLAVVDYLHIAVRFSPGGGIQLQAYQFGCQELYTSFALHSIPLSSASGRVRLSNDMESHGKRHFNEDLAGGLSRWI
jgi:hypothetical protein